MEGLQGIRVASLGDGMVILFSEVGMDVGGAIQKRSWWEGLLKDFLPWSPTLKSANREIWVRVYGVPLQLWNENVFRSLTEQWGTFIGLDEDTRGRVRFDVGRVKISAPILGTIDSTVKVMVQGLMCEIRVMEERGGDLLSLCIFKKRRTNYDGVWWILRVLPVTGVRQRLWWKGWTPTYQTVMGLMICSKVTQKWCR
jgi:hypothetical protein